MRFYCDQQLGKTQFLTPEGFLVCADVPIARTGTMLYAAGEVPVEPGPDHIVRIERDAEQVFRPETIASFVGKPVVDDHPGEDVTPRNWRDYAVGTVQNVRRGDGILDDFLLADLLITDQEAIDAVRDGKREVSCGYDADYQALAPGYGRQLNIIGNHVALVDKGRCGPRCAIGDKAMAKARRRSIWDRMTSAWHARDEAAFKAAVRDAEEAEEREDDDDPAHHHVTVNVNHSGSESNTEHEKDTEDSTIKQLADSVKAIDSRLAKVEDSLKHFDASKAEKDAKEEKEAKEDKDKARDEEVEIEQEILSGDARGKSRDEAMRAAFQDTLARAEILAPGIRLPTHDAKADAKATFRSLCALRRRALDVAQATDAGRASVAPLLGARTVDAMSCAEVRAVFVSASEIAKRSNNGVTAGGTFDRSYSSVKIPTPAEINAKNREFWKQRQV